ncbi:hypothetical protein [Undibacterium sp. Xuan67W]|uniref:hypothetical protein n=1 Tax=Undibacterium sp. Xuan67W TaxID=3413057 RepID=UPI003BF2DB91
MPIFRYFLFCIKVVLTMAGLYFLLSCSTSPPLTKIKNVQISAMINSNQNTATAIDLVFIYDSNALLLLPKTGPEWFEKKNAIINGLANSVDVVSLQVPPITLMDVVLPTRHGKAIAVYSFANYLSVDGQSFGNLTPYVTVQIVLTPTNVLYKGS